MSFDLHTADKKADWEYITPREHSWWQRVAAKTHGIITPGNIITILGFIIVIKGLVLLVHDNYTLGIFAILIGRLADVLDGIIAARTRTKSPLGEIVDSAADKFILLAALICMVFYFTIPWIVVGFIFLQNIINSIMSGYAMTRGHSLHPSRVGKYATVACWIVIVLYLALSKSDNPLIELVAAVVFSVYVVTGSWASIQYIRQATLK